MTAQRDDLLTLFQTVNAGAPFHRWAGIEVAAADASSVEVRLAWREEFANYAGLLHAGVITALLETACGFAGAAACGGNVAASHFA